jgi:hypothetical protein
MLYGLRIPRWLRMYVGVLAVVLLIIALALHVVGSLALAANVSPLLGLVMLALAWPLAGIAAVSLALLWLASVMGFWKLGRLLLSFARPAHASS